MTTKTTEKIDILHQYKVLIAEDSEADFELYQNFLEKDIVYKYQIFQAETGKEFLELFLNNKPDLVLIDFSLPDMDGLQLIESLHKIDDVPYTPIIMLTGQGNELIALEAMKHNVTDYWMKGDLDFNSFINGIYQAITMIEQNKSSTILLNNVINILIVDDSEIDLELYSRFLKKDTDHIFNIYTKSTGKEALEFCEHKQIDIILTDYELPDINGVTLIEKIKKIINLEHFPIIMMTGHGNEQLVVNALKKGASDYLVKQFITPEVLRKNIKDTLLKSRLLTEVERTNFQRSLLSKISLNIRKSLNLNHIIQTACLEVKKYMDCDRVVIFKFDDNNGKVIGEAVNKPYTQTLGLNIKETFFKEAKNRNDYIESCRRQVLNDVSKANLADCHRELLDELQVKSIVTLPIIIENLPDPLWGLLIIHFCKETHYWEQSEVAFLQEISFQISIGIQQGLLVEELRKERDRSNQATKAKSEFLANMSHEIRTPMTGILGMAELALMSDLDEQVKDYINIIQSSGKNLLNLINDILDLSKLEAGKIELDKHEFNLSELLDEVVHLLRISSKDKDLTISLNLDEKLPNQYLGDSYRLRQILINLIGNAIKFTPKGGKIEVMVKEEKTAKNLKKVAAIETDKIVLYFGIKDTGIGIAYADQKKLFQPFSQVEGATTRK
ncbi:MAG TPA: response regulator, partial [Allocoleopsis sp.]